MAKVKAASSSSSSQKMRPALSPEARMNQLTSLAVDLVEQRLRDGTASSQETTTFLKYAANTREMELKNKLLEAQAEMAIAKKEALQAQRRSDEMFEKAIKAFRRYSGQDNSEDEEEIYDDYQNLLKIDNASNI